MYLQPYGQACTQYAQPRQYFGSTSTTPSGVTNVAPTGHTCVQGESAHWLHSFGTKKYFPASSCATGNPSLPPSGEITSGFVMFPSVTWYRSTHVRKCPSGTSFSAAQALTQFPQPMHLGISISIPHQCSDIL